MPKCCSEFPAWTLGTLSIVIYHIYVKLHVIRDFKILIMFTNQLTLSHIWALFNPISSLKTENFPWLITGGITKIQSAIRKNYMHNCCVWRQRVTFRDFNLLRMTLAERQRGNQGLSPIIIGTEFWQQSEWTWKQFFPITGRLKPSPVDLWFWLHWWQKLTQTPDKKYCERVNGCYFMILICGNLLHSNRHIK